MTTAESLLCSVLGCGVLDFSILDDCKYCWDDVLVEMQDSGMKICLESICYSILRIGMRQMQDAIDERINEIEDALIESERNMDVEYKALLSISPYDDLMMYFNYLDTHVWFERNSDVYREYMSEAVEAFENDTGFVVEGD